MEADAKFPQDIDAYIAQLPPAVQTRLKRLRALIRKAAPEATEIIKYRMPTFVLHGNLVHFAAYQNHIGFYPVPTAIVKFKKQLAPYPTAKGSVQFPLDQPLPLDLIRQIVEFRVKENLAKAAAKAKKK